jgi:hypothetical protein
VVAAVWAVVDFGCFLVESWLGLKPARKRKSQLNQQSKQPKQSNAPPQKQKGHHVARPPAAQKARAPGREAPLSLARRRLFAVRGGGVGGCAPAPSGRLKTKAKQRDPRQLHPSLSKTLNETETTPNQNQNQNQINKTKTTKAAQVPLHGAGRRGRAVRRPRHGRRHV